MIWLALTAQATETRLYYTHLDVVRYNPIGLESRNGLFIHQTLTNSESLLFGHSYVSPGVLVSVNPAYLRVGPAIEVEPIALLKLRAAYEGALFFGTFDQVLSEPGVPDPSLFTDDARSARGDEAYGTTGHHVQLDATLQAKVWRIVVRSNLTAEWWNVDLREGDDVFFNLGADSVIPDGGWVISNNADLLYMQGHLIFGGRLSSVWPQLGGVKRYDHHRAGPLAAWVIHDAQDKKLEKPTVFANVAWYLSHRSRLGPIPYVVAGFAVKTNLLR